MSTYGTPQSKTECAWPCWTREPFLGTTSQIQNYTHQITPASSRVDTTRFLPSHAARDMYIIYLSVVAATPFRQQVPATTLYSGGKAYVILYVISQNQFQVM